MKKVYLLWFLGFCGLIQAQSTLLEPYEFNNLVGDTTWQKLDVRTGAEFIVVGHIPGFSQISLTDPDFEKKVLAEFDPQQPVLLTCFSGHRSADAVKRLEKVGFKKIAELKGGLIRWMGKGYELE
jgi:rhodanese-related sulfurtransferase